MASDVFFSVPDGIEEAVDAGIEAVAAAGADDIGQIDFGLTDETRAELRDQALEEALANADDEARYIAENRNVTITGTKSVSTRNVDVVAATADRSYMTEADDDAAAGPSTDIDSGPARVTASVDAVYGFENTD